MKPNFKNIIIGILALTILGLSCYFIYNKYKHEDNIDTPVVEDEKKIQEDLTNIIKEYGLDGLGYEESDITFSDKPRNSQLYLIALYYTNTNKDKDYILSREELDDYYEKVYGYKPVSYINIKCQVEKQDLYIYKDNKYYFNKSHPGHGYYGYGFIDSFITDYSKNDNTYTISILFLRGNEMEGYSVNENDLFRDDSYKGDYTDKSLSKYFRDNIDHFIKGMKYQYTFEKNNGRYILKSFKKIK